MANRFDYVRYDERSMKHQSVFKHECTVLDELIDNRLKPSRARSTAIRKLEECYMWIGKAIRDDQIERNGSAPLEEERNSR